MSNLVETALEALNKCSDLVCFSNPDFEKDVLRIPIQLLDEFLNKVPDKFFNTLAYKFSFEDEKKFQKVLNHIVYHRSELVWRYIFMTGEIASRLSEAFKLAPEAYMKMLPVILPIFLLYRPHIYRNFLYKIVQYLKFEEILTYKKNSKTIMDILDEKGIDLEKEMIELKKETRVDMYSVKRVVENLNQYSNYSYSTWKTLQSNVLGSTSKYIWDTICGKTSKNVTKKDVNKLKEFASVHGITNVENMNHRQLCARLSDVSQYSTADCDVNDVDPWTMESMSEIPRERWYKIGQNCFDINSLNEAVKRGDTFNPFNRSWLDVEDIRKRHNIVQNTIKTNKIHELKDVPMLTKEQYISQILLNVWGHMKYPVPLSDFLKASENELDMVFESFKKFALIILTRKDFLMYAKKISRD